MSTSRWWLKVVAWLEEKLFGWLVADGSRCSYVTVIICIDMSLGCDDNPKGLCQAGGGRRRGRGCCWLGRSSQRSAAAVYKMLITPTTKALVVFWKRPRKAAKPKWFTKGPRQFTGHLTASPRQASTNCVFRKGSWAEE